VTAADEGMSRELFSLASFDAALKAAAATVAKAAADEARATMEELDKMSRDLAPSVVERLQCDVAERDHQIAILKEMLYAFGEPEELEPEPKCDDSRITRWRTRWDDEQRPFAATSGYAVHEKSCRVVRGLVDLYADVPWGGPEALSRDEAIAWLEIDEERRGCQICAPELPRLPWPPVKMLREAGFYVQTLGTVTTEVPWRNDWGLAVPSPGTRRGGCYIPGFRSPFAAWTEAHERFLAGIAGGDPS
jgi:hypothetical protein